MFLPKSIIFLIGNLGFGKTFFVKSILGFILKYRIIIRSPTYSLINYYYFNNIYFYHLDFYRILDNKKFIEIDIINILNNKFFLFIEWGNSILNKFFFPNINIFFFKYQNFFNRFLIIKSYLNNFNFLI